MPSFWDRINPIGKHSYVSPLANKQFRKGAMNFLTGSPAERENVSNLRPEQEGLYQQAVNAGMGKGAGGAFGEAADYYRGLMDPNSPEYQQFSAPALRQYNEEIVPGISEQFAAMGAGGSGLSGSGFQNAQIQGATDLSERLGALRANLRHSGAQGLANIGQIGLGNYSQNMETKPGTQGFLATALPAVGAVAGTALGGPALGAAGYQAGSAAQNWFGGKGQQVGVNSNPYGQGGPQASANIRRPGGGGSYGGMQQPGYMQGQGRGF